MVEEQQFRDMQRQVDRHELRLDTLEGLLKAQIEALNKVIDRQDKLQNRLTIIGSILIGVIGVSSEQGGLILRTLFGVGG